MASGELLLEFIEALPEIKKHVEGAADALTRYWRTFQDTAFATGRALGMSRDAAMRFDRALMQEAKDLSRAYGISAKDIAKYQENYGQATGRNIALTREQTEQMAALSKVAGDATANKLIEEFEGLGVSVSDTLAYTGQIQERAKFLGLNGTKAAASMADNIKLAASYSFRNGVDDIERMVLKSQSLKMNMQAVMTAADKFSDIQGAIETSANLQMLGGTFAQQFSNPMGALYESMADPAAFQDRLIKTIGGKGKYDAKTGQVTFDPITMAQMKETAKQLGMSVEELTKPAMAIQQNAAIDKEISNKNWTDEQKTAIENLSRTNVDEKTGKHYVTWIDENGQSQKSNVEDLTPEQLKVAQDSNMTQDKMWEDVHAIKNKIVGETVSRARGTVSFNQNLEGLKEEGRAYGAQLQNGFMSTISGLFNGKNFSLWDIFKTTSSGLGTVNGLSGKVEGFSGTGGGPKYGQGFANGGIVHAENGAIVPGDSYYGDNVPIRANSGEMILNNKQQSGLFSLISGIAKEGLGILAGNMIGARLGLGRLGTQGFMMQMLGGGNLMSGMMTSAVINKLMSHVRIPKMSAMPKPATGIGLGANGMGGILVTPNTKQAKRANRAAVAGNTLGFKGAKNDLKSFRAGLKDVFKTGFPESKKSLNSFKERVNNSTQGLQEFGRKAKQAGKNAAEAFHLDRTGRRIKNVGAKIGKFGGNVVAKTKGAYHVASEKYASAKARVTDWGNTRIDKFKNTSVGRFGTRLKSDVGRFGTRFKALNRLNRIRSVANGSSLGSLGANAGKIGTRLNGIGRIFKVGSAMPNIAKSAGMLGKVASIGGKGLSKIVPGLGTLVAVGSSIGGLMSASSDYDAKKQEIMSSNMSDEQKEQALNEAKDEKRGAQGKAVGSGIGMAAGTAIGATLGSAVPVLGTVIGGAVGGFVGEKVGGLVGGLAKPFSKMARGIKNTLFGHNKDKEQSAARGELNGNTLSEKANDAVIKIYEIMAKKDNGGPIRARNAHGVGTMVTVASAFASPALGIANLLLPKIKSLPTVGKKQIIRQNEKASIPPVTSVEPKDINLNVSGTIKLDLGGKQTDIDARSILNNPAFKSQIAEIISKELNTMGNGGKYNKEGSVRNTQSLYNGNK